MLVGSFSFVEATASNQVRPTSLPHGNVSSITLDDHLLQQSLFWT